MDLADVQEIIDKLDLAGGIGDGLCDLVHIIDDLDAVIPQELGKVIMLLLRDLEIRDIVEQESPQGGGSQRLQLLAGAVQQHLVELADLGKVMNTWIHGRVLPGMPAALSRTARASLYVF